MQLPPFCQYENVSSSQYHPETRLTHCTTHLASERPAVAALPGACCGNLGVLCRDASDGRSTLLLVEAHIPWKTCLWLAKDHAVRSKEKQNEKQDRNMKYNLNPPGNASTKE